MDDTMLHWFTKPEILDTINDIITKIQLCNVDVGDAESQLLLMYLVADQTNIKAL